MKQVAVTLALLAVLGLALPLANLVAGPPDGALEHADLQRHPGLATVQPLLTTKCANCHTTRGKMPFYGALPGAQGLIEHHVRDALRHLNLESLLASPQPVPAAILQELTETLDAREMPPWSYILLHWDGAVNEAETAALQTWIREERMPRANTPAAAPSTPPETK